MKKWLLIFSFLLVGCVHQSSTEEQIEPIDNQENNQLISAVDISSLPEILETNPVFYDFDGNPTDFLDIIQENGVNTIRLRLWVNPTSKHSDLQEVKTFSTLLRNKGFKIWLTLHYSGSWADPAKQSPPKSWQNIDFQELKDSVYAHTEKVVENIEPDFIQIGNEINTGILHPKGKITTESQQFKELINEGIQAVRNHKDKTKIILHFAGIEGAECFFDQINALDYDMIGLSYYPIWHGKSLEKLKNTLTFLAENYQKEVIIAETAYPFSLLWNDYTNNVVGLENQLILPEFSATPDGQQKFIREIKQIVLETKSAGFCYWGAELIAWKTNTSVDASSWENQALFDFENHALPVLREFQID